ncbi:SDR family oxidoreductase [Arthrobacter methylotrophus]|uniref:SDR family oxidoreductase n=1 Tax=Arthrobacter methylotrophus TaxID=121291 RepID=A0ABV5UMN3_9MICC
MAGPGPVLVVGGTGLLGAQVVSELLARGKQVRALVRHGSDAARLETLGATIARGDMMEPASLLRAMDGVDSVVTSAAGYTRHREGDSPLIDTVGNINLVDAASQADIRRFVLTSILTCDQTPDVPHFWHKKLAEDRLEELGVPFVALRPGAFLDQVTRFGGDPFSKGQLTWFGSVSVPLTFVLTRDLAGYLAAAVDANGVDGQRIDIGWDRPVSMEEIAGISARLLGRQVLAIPGTSNTMAKDFKAMMDWFATGRYVADTARQSEVFGPPPTGEDAVARLLSGLGHAV